jgi:predicted dithiol-disulfide oxidoreductase (DUF899 family)/sugar lactone lactonase YvrE
MYFQTIVSREEWLAQRAALLAKEKAMTRALDELAAERRRLPWEKVEKDYAFDSPSGRVGLADLFEGRSQLIVYHHMLKPADSNPCPGCGMVADHIGHLAHLHARDTTLALVSRAPITEIEAFKKRMGWAMPWVSTIDDFNSDFGLAGGFGLNVFLRASGEIFRTYFTSGRGVERLGATWTFLDLTLLGRQRIGRIRPNGPRKARPINGGVFTTNTTLGAAPVVALDAGEPSDAEEISGAQGARPDDRPGVRRIAALARRSPVLLELGRAGDHRGRSRGKERDCRRPPTGLPFCIDWAIDGRLLIVSGRECLVLRQEENGALTSYADLTALSDRGWNEIVVDGRGAAYVNGVGFDMMAGEAFAPGIIARIAPDGTPRQVADGIAFPNGMVVTSDNATLIVAESYGRKLTAFDIGADGDLSNRRVWADLGDGVPDGICLDAEGAVWFADVPNKRCRRVAEGGAILDEIACDRGCFACMLGGADGKTLFVLAAEWRGPENMIDAARTGQLLAFAAPAPRAGFP